MRILILILLMPLLSFAQKDSSIYVAGPLGVNGPVYYWKTPTQVKGILSISNISDTTSTNIYNALAGKQTALVSATNIKTVNGSTILGSGDLTISGADSTVYYTKYRSDTSRTNIYSSLNGKQPLTTNLTSFGGLANFSGYLYNNGSGTFSYETPAGAGTVTSVSVVSANGFAGSVATSTSTPAITLTTSITGVLKGNGTAISAASAGTDYLAPSGDGSALTGLTASQVGLGSVNNTSDAGKPVSTAQQTALDLKANIASPTFTGTVGGITASMVGLANVTNESKATMFTSPAFTGTPTGIGIPVYAQVTGSDATTTGQVLTNITGLSVALTASAVYEFEAVMTGSTTAVTTGTGYAVQYSAAGAAVEAFVTASSTATVTKTLRISALNTSAQAFLTGSAQTGGILIKGRVTTGANAGNLTIQHLKVTSGTSTIFIGSFLKVTRIS